MQLPNQHVVVYVDRIEECLQKLQLLCILICTKITQFKSAQAATENTEIINMLKITQIKPNLLWSIDDSCVVTKLQRADNSGGQREQEITCYLLFLEGERRRWTTRGDDRQERGEDE